VLEKEVRQNKGFDYMVTVFPLLKCSLRRFLRHFFCFCYSERGGGLLLLSVHEQVLQAALLQQLAHARAEARAVQAQAAARAGSAEVAAQQTIEAAVQVPCIFTARCKCTRQRCRRAT
jgi:hypothetical protein